MGLNLVGQASLSGTATASESADCCEEHRREKCCCEKHREKARDHLQKVLSGVLYALAEVASGEAVGDLERSVWHLQMACNYLKLAAGETGTAEADTVDTARERLTERFFWLQASMVRHRGAGGHAQALLEGLEVMAAVSSLLPADASAAESPGEQTYD